MLKERFPKLYRHPDLERKLTKARMAQEVRCSTKARAAGVAAPAVLAVNALLGQITMEFVPGAPLRDVFETAGVAQIDKLGICRRLGQLLAKLHNAGIVHGDLTTSNVMRRPGPDGELVLIDFGLSKSQAGVEDKAVDMYVLERAFSSTHPGSEALFVELLGTYHAALCDKDRLKVVAKYASVQARGRKREMIG